jgi:tetratricopeptide (TPR) repeat protein
LNTTVPKSVFISYSTGDTAVTEQIRNGLESTGIPCWMAPRDIVPGLDYGTQIIEAIEACTVLLLVLSESSNYSIYVRKEVERATAKGKVIIPFRIQEVIVSRSLEFFISETQWIDGWGDALATATATLEGAVRGHLQSRSQTKDRGAPEGAERRASRGPDAQPPPIHSPSPTHRPMVERAVFVGRETQLAQLKDALTQALRGHGQLRFVTGEAGAGKSALLNEFHYRVTAEFDNLMALTGACDAQTGLTDPYLPFREILSWLAGDPETGQVLREQGPNLIDTLVPASALADYAGGANPFPHDAPVNQSQIFEQVVKVFQAAAIYRPLLLVLEDLHWADDATTGLLLRLGRHIKGSRILVLGAYRSEEVSMGQAGQPHPLQTVVDELRRTLGDIGIDLDAVRAAEGMNLVDALLDSEPNRLDAAFRQALHDHTGGHPLFVVELLRDLQKCSGLVRDQDGEWIVRAALNWADLPARVEGMIALRMGRLEAEERQLLTAASVMGEHFIAEVVAQALKLDERRVALQLSGSLQKQHRLVQSEGVERLGGQRITRYRFSHNLMQVYLYEQLDAAERSFLHEDIGNVAESLFGEHTQVIAIHLAHHFRAARIPAKAIHYLTLAGEQAVRAVAFAEASSHFTQALALLATLPETTERVERQLSLLLSLGAVLSALAGYSDPKVAHTYSQMRDILPKLGQDPRVFLAVMALERFYAVCGEARLQFEMATQALQMAQAAQHPVWLVGGHQVMGNALCFKGQFAPARIHLERCLSLYDPEEEYTIDLPDDPGVVATIFLGFTLWSLGLPDQALQRFQEALSLAQGLTNRSYRETLSLSMMAMFYQRRRDVTGARRVAEAAIALANKLEFLFLEALARAVHGWALAMQGEVAIGVAQMRQSVAKIRAMGDALFLPHVLAMLAETYGKSHQPEEGLILTVEGLEVVGKSTFQWMEADLHLLSGVLQLQQPDCDHDAEASFQRAIAVARLQEAKILELRATVNLARLWHTQGKSLEARYMLAELYNWFTEGSDTEDLQEARALLAELESKSCVSP